MATKTLSLACDADAFDLASLAMCVTYGYQAQVPDPDNPGQTKANPVTPGDFAKQQIINFIKDVTRAYLHRQKEAEAKAQAAALAQAQVDAITVTADVVTS